MRSVALLLDPEMKLFFVRGWGGGGGGGGITIVLRAAPVSQSNPDILGTNAVYFLALLGSYGMQETALWTCSPSGGVLWSDSCCVGVVSGADGALQCIGGKSR